MSSAPAIEAAADTPQTASIDLRRKRLRDRRCFAISAASAPPPCKTSYCCGVTGGVSILIVFLSIVCIARAHSPRAPRTEAASPPMEEACHDSLHSMKIAHPIFLTDQPLYLIVYI